MADAKIFIVTGKGGVGKSSIAAGLALAQAKEGRRTLLVEFGEESYFKYLFDLEQVGFEPKTLGNQWHNLHLALWNGRQCLRDYVAHILKLQTLTDLFFENAAMKAFIDAAPALSDVSILGKLTSGIRRVGPQFPYDTIIVDGYAAGHIMAMVRAPKSLSEAIRVGAMGDQSREILNVISDENLCRFVIVSLAEDLPVTESLELHQSLHHELQTHPSLILNRMSPEPEIESLSDDFYKKREKFCDYLKAIKERQEQSRQRLSTLGSFPHEISQVFAKDSADLLSTLRSSLEGVTL